MLVVPRVHLLLQRRSFDFQIARDFEQRTMVVGRRHLATRQITKSLPIDEMEARCVMPEVSARLSRTTVATSSHQNLGTLQFGMHLDDLINRGERVHRADLGARCAGSSCSG